MPCPIDCRRDLRLPPVVIVCLVEIVFCAGGWQACAGSRASGKMQLLLQRIVEPEVEDMLSGRGEIFEEGPLSTYPGRYEPPSQTMPLLISSYCVHLSERGIPGGFVAVRGHSRSLDEAW